MKLVHGLLDYSDNWVMPDIYLFTGNPIVKRNGAIVMGRGAAKQVRDAYPGVDISFGRGVTQHPDSHLLWVRLLDHEHGGAQHIGWFKVKHHWQAPAVLELIQESANQLGAMASSNAGVRFHMNYPGVGNGKLQVTQVEGILASLPDNIFIYSGAKI